MYLFYTISEYAIYPVNYYVITRRLYSSFIVVYKKPKENIKQVAFCISHFTSKATYNEICLNYK